MPNPRTTQCVLTPYKAQVTVGGIKLAAYRLSWQLANGREVPAGVDVCHTCDVGNCINPEHLFLCTQAENMADMKAKRRGGGRLPVRGWRLSPTERLELEHAGLLAAASSHAIAARFGVTATHVRRTRRGV